MSNATLLTSWWTFQIKLGILKIKPIIFQSKTFAFRINLRSIHYHFLEKFIIHPSQKGEHCVWNLIKSSFLQEQKWKKKTIAYLPFIVKYIKTASFLWIDGPIHSSSLLISLYLIAKILFTYTYALVDGTTKTIVENTHVPVGFK